ncbi:MAG: hypothetical protein QMB94_07010, partial [Phycisphaerales bacterium]
ASVGASIYVISNAWSVGGYLHVENNPALETLDLSALASVVGGIVLPSTVVAMAFGGEDGSLRASLPFLIVTVAIATFVVFRHRKNLMRIRTGAEPRVGRKTSTED